MSASEGLFTYIFHFFSNELSLPQLFSCQLLMAGLTVSPESAGLQCSDMYLMQGGVPTQ